MHDSSFRRCDASQQVGAERVVLHTAAEIEQKNFINHHDFI